MYQTYVFLRGFNPTVCNDTILAVKAELELRDVMIGEIIPELLPQLEQLQVENLLRFISKQPTLISMLSDKQFTGISEELSSFLEKYEKTVEILKKSCQA